MLQYIFRRNVNNLKEEIPDVKNYVASSQDTFKFLLNYFYPHQEGENLCVHC